MCLLNYDFINLVSRVLCYQLSLLMCPLLMNSSLPCMTARGFFYCFDHSYIRLINHLTAAVLISKLT